MTWILAVYLSSGVYTAEFRTEKECVIEMRKLIVELESKKEKFDKVICEQGIVIDEDENSVGF